MSFVDNNQSNNNIAPLPTNNQMTNGEKTVSCLTQKIAPSKPMTDKILSHVNEDFYIAKATGQEGNIFSDSIEYMIQFLNKLPEKLKSEQIVKTIKNFEQCLELEKLLEAKSKSKDPAYEIACDLQSKIRDLQANQKLFFCGGWNGTIGGHAIMHAIEKQADGKYTLYTYNTGDGIDFHDFKVDSQGNHRVSTTIKQTNIETRNMMNINLLTSLFDLRTNSLSKDDSTYGGHIIYDSILPAFGGDVQTKNSIRPMREQRSGTCSWKVLTAMLNEVLDPVSYKRIKQELRLQMLEGYIKEHSKLDKDQYFRLSQDLEKFCRELNKPGLKYEEAELKEYINKFELLKQQVASAYSNQESSTSGRVLPIKNSEAYSCQINNLVLKLPEIKSEKVNETPRISVVLPTECSDKTKIGTHLKEWVQLAEKLYGNAQHQDLIFAVNKMIKSLPLPIPKVKDEAVTDPFWGNSGERSREEIAVMIQSLSRLSELIFQSCFHLKRSHGDEQASVITCLAIQTKLIENLLNYTRSFKASGILGLQQRRMYEAHKVHIEAALKTNSLAHDPILSERTKACADLLGAGTDISNFLGVFIGRGFHNDSYYLGGIGNQDELVKIRESIEEKSKARNLFLTYSEEYKKLLTPEELANPDLNRSLIAKIMDYDFGQFGMLPDFLAAVNRQVFITSYFFAVQNFSSRSRRARFPNNPFTIQTVDAEQIEEIFRQNDWQQMEVWVDGARIGYSDSAFEVIEKTMNKTFKNSDIRKLLREYIDKSRWSMNPNRALVEYSQCTSLSPENTKELITLINSPKKVVCWQVLNYFTRHIDKLKERDYQTLFEWILYPRLGGEMKNNPNFANDLLRFIQNNLQEFQAPSDIDGYLYLIRLGIHLEKVCNNKGVKNTNFPDWLTLLTSKQKKSSNAYEKKALQAQIAHLLSAISAEPSVDTIKNVVSGLSLLQTGQVREGLKDLTILRCVLEWLQKNDGAVKSLSADAVQGLCSVIYSTVNNLESPNVQKWHCVEYPIYESEDKQVRVNLLTAEVFMNNSACTALPRTISEDGQFIRLFGTNTENVNVEGFKRYNFRCKGHDFRVEVLNGSNLAIEQNIEGKWFRFIPDGKELSLPQPLVEGWTHWMLPEIDETSQLYIQNAEFNNYFVGIDNPKFVTQYDIETGDPIQVKQTAFEIHQNKNQDLVFIDQNKFCEKDALLSVFESPEYICGWRNSQGEVQEINYSRYNLNFTCEKSKDGGLVYASKEFPGYHIAMDQRAEHFPYVPKFLVLSNAAGHRKVLLPSLSFKRTISPEHPLVGDVKFQKDLPFSYQAFDIDKEGKPKKLNQEQALLLVYQALTQKDYESARTYLEIAEQKSGDNLNPIAEKILDLVLDEDAQDNHPKALAIALRIGIVVLKNKLYKAKSSDLKKKNDVNYLLKPLQKIYSKYHRADLNACNLIVSPKEELYLLQQLYNNKMLSDSEFDRFLYLIKRKPLEEVQRSAPGAGEENGIELKSTSEWNNGLSDLAKWIDALDPQYSDWCGVHNIIGIPLTRSEKNFVPYFIKVCLEIDEYTTKQEKMAHLAKNLRFIKWTESMAFLRVCLEEIVQNPTLHAERLTKLKEIVKEPSFKRALYIWFKELAEVVQKKQKSKEKQIEVKPYLDLSEVIQLPPRATSITISKSDVKNSQTSSLGLNYFEPSDKPLPFEPLPPLDENKKGLEPYEKHHICQFNKELKKFYEKDPREKSFKLKNSEGLIGELKSTIAKEKGVLKIKRQLLLAKANGEVDSQSLPLSIRLAESGGLKKSVTFEELIVLYLQGSQDAIFSKCPGLKNSPNAAHELVDSISEYLVQTTALQQQKRVLQKVSKVHELELQRTKETNHDLEKEIENTTNEAYALASASRVYSTSSYPEWLVFEWASDILLREDQKHVLELLQKGNVDSAETEVIIQLIMGAGKSKVLLPLLALKRADGEKLSMIVVPSSLYETNRRDLKTCSLEKLHQEPVAFEFNRSTPFTEEELQGKLWDLQNAIVNKNYVVTTPESLLCLKLKYNEVLHQISEGSIPLEKAERKLKILASILDLIKNRGSAILDEADTILNIRREVNFPIGSTHGVPKEQLKLVRKFYEFLLKSDVEPQLLIKANKPEAFKKSEFTQTIAPQLADYLIEGWDLGKINKQELRQYLLGTYKEEKLKGLSDHAHRKEIALAKELITTFLPSVLNKKGNEGFGLSHQSNNRYPIPYKGNNTPDETSEFGNVYETLLYAVHIYAQDGLKESHIDALLQQTCQKIRFESKDRGCSYKDTPTFKKFTSIYEVENPFDVRADERLKISLCVKNKKEALFHWLSNFVFPEIRTTKQKINANALTLVEMIGHVQGFTGTPWNRPTYHDRLNKPEREQELSSPESELKILHAIYQKVKDGGIHTLSEKSAPEILNKMIADFKFDCLIDVGALLNGITNVKIAEELKKSAAKQQLSAVVYFNDENELVADLMDGSKPIGLTKVSLDKFVSYYDQIHTTGTDITQRPTAKALMTFGNKTIRDMTQGAMRMRRLLTSQNIEIVIPSELASQISPEGKKTTFDQLLSYAVLQQAHKLSDDIVRKVRMQMKHIVATHLDSFLKQQTISTQAELHHLFEDVLTDINSDDPFEEFGEGFAWEDTLKELEHNRAQQIQIVQRLFSEERLLNLSPDIQQGLLKVKKQMDVDLTDLKMPSKELLKNQIPKVHKADLKQDTKVEIEKEIEIEVEQEVKTSDFRAKNYKLWANFEKSYPYDDPQFYSPDRIEKNELMPQVVRVNSLLGQEKDLEGFKAIFDADLCTTELFRQSVEPQPKVLFGKEAQKTAYQIVFVVEPDKSMRAILVDPVEASKFKEIVSKTYDLPGRKLILQDLTTGNTQSRGGPLSEIEQSKFDRLAVQAKFFNGQLEYTKNEWKLLTQWLNSIDTKKAKQLFELIVNSQLGLAKKYEKSTLGKKWRESLQLV